MNILIFNFEYPPIGGGGGVLTADLSTELANRHTVHVITSATKDNTGTKKENGVIVHRVPALGRNQRATASIRSMLSYVLTAFFYSWKLSKSTSFDIVNAQFVLPSGIPAYGFSILRGVPLVVSLIGGDIYDPTKGTSPHRHVLLRFFIRVITQHASACTAISEDIKRRAETYHNVQRPITVIHLAARTSKASSITRAELNLPEHVPIAICIGRLIPRKGFTTLLDAWTMIPAAHLIIVGDGPLSETLQQKARDRHISERIHFTGFVSEEHKHQLLRNSDMYVSAALHEGFGIVFLEAMGAGLPIVTTANGGQADFLDSGKNAIFAQENNPKAIASAVNELLANKTLRHTMSKENIEHAKKYSVDRMASAYENVFLKTLKNI